MSSLSRFALAALSILILNASEGFSAVPQDFAVDLKATVSDTAPHIVLNWTQRIQSNITAQKIHRRLKGETVWVKLADLTTTDTSYTDHTALPGIEYEYWMERTLNLSPNRAMGYLSAGVKVPEVHDRGKLLLLIDATLEPYLVPEIDQLKADLAADGWTVQAISAPRSGTALSTKALITAAYNSDAANVKQVYVLGHVPVPHSGNSAPDGHGNHGGAWSADGYYGEMDGTWTDSTVNNTTPDRAENDNVPGDGKFDQTQFPSLVELGVGRVDMYRLGRAPSAISATPEVELSLLRRYLHKAHEFRHKKKRYAAIPRRTLIRDGFGHAFTSEPFAVSAWAGAYSSVGHPPTSPIVAAPSWEWFTPSYAGGQDYLWGHGCGGGSYESASSFGNSTDFGHKPSRVVFTSIFGSYHGDWDSDHNLMRAALAGNPDGDSLSLCCFWQGRPNFFVHHLGMGETLGFMAKTSMNAGVIGGGAYVPGGSSFRGTHIGLLGDPALRIHHVEPPRRLAARSLSGRVELSWAASTETGLQGYHVYRSSSPYGPFARLTGTPQASTSYTDSAVTPGNSYTYLVRTLKLEDVPGGSYYNLSVGSAVTITASSAAVSPPLNPSALTVIAQPSSVQANITWQDNASDETGYRIEQKAGAAGSWSTLTTLASGSTGFADPGPFTHLETYFYRVIATNAAGDSIPSNVDSFEASAGFIELTDRAMTVNKNAGSVPVGITRFGGATGQVTVQYATSNSSATASTHYTSTSGTLVWEHGESSVKTFTVPVTNTASPQQGRQFSVTLSNPSNGARLGVFNRISVLIEDSTATLDPAWQQVFLGTAPSFPYGTCAYSSAASDAEGFIGSTMIGGSLASGGTSDTGRFVYQQRSGDGTMTARIFTTSPSNSSARMALMVRATPTNTAKMAGVVATSSTGATGYGTKLVYRTSTALVETPGSSNQLVTPCWLRLTRLGDLFVGEHSTDGVNWTTVAQNTVSGIPPNASWGLFNTGGGVALSSDYSANYQLSRFESVSFGTIPAPDRPDGVALTSVSNSSVTLQWNTKPYSATYLVQRRAEGESFGTIATVTAGAAATQTSSSSVSGDTAYEYRVIAANSTGQSAPSEIVRTVTPPGDIEILRTAEADATIRAESPDENFGADSLLTVSGPHPVTYELSAAAKSYLRFNAAGLPGSMKTAQLRLAHVANRFLDETGYYYSAVAILTTDTADAWDESTITWNNAPLNDTAGAGLLGSYAEIGYHYLGTFPAPGTQSSVSLTTSTLQNNVGANNLVTIVAMEEYEAAQADWASKEHGTYVAPTLRMTFSNPLPRRPGFLAVSSGPGGTVLLSWLDASADETGFQIERRAANGQWTLLATLAPDTAGFEDGTALPGVLYEYRVRAIGSTGESSWTMATTTASTSAAAITAAAFSLDGATVQPAEAPPGNAYIPTGFEYYPASLNFVTSTTLSTSALRNNSDTWRGFKFTVGANHLVIREMARWVLSGNTGQHTVRIVDAATSQTVPGASVVIDTAASPVGYKYAVLPVPVVLPAGASFYLVSQEFNGGDQWYEGNCTLTHNSSVATVDQSVWSNSAGTVFTLNNGAGNTYIPVTFRYSEDTRPFVTGHGMTRLRNDVDGWLGMTFRVGSSPVLVSQLGRWVVAGNTGSHALRLLDASGAILATATVNTLGAPSGQFVYAALSPCVSLSANATYSVLSQETAGGDQWYDFAAAPAPGSPSGYQQWLLGNGLPMDGSGQGSATATPAGDGLPNLIKFALGLDPAGSGHGGRLAQGTVEESGADYLTFSYTRPEPAPAGITYSVEGSPDLTPSSWTTGGIVPVGSSVENGLCTVTVRDSTAMAGNNKRFLRLKVSQP